jgi:hypothetical protein
MKKFLMILAGVTFILATSNNIFAQNRTRINNSSDKTVQQQNNPLTLSMRHPNEKSRNFVEIATR